MCTVLLALIYYSVVLKSKIPQLKQSHTVSKQDWQVLMKEREALRKLRGKEYKNRTRRTKSSDIEQGDLILLENKFQKDKVATNFEEKPYKVIERNGNAVVVENDENGRKMKNTNQMKKYMQNVGLHASEDMEQIADEKLPSEEIESRELIGEKPETRPPDTEMTPQVKEKPTRHQKLPSKFSDHCNIVT